MNASMVPTRLTARAVTVCAVLVGLFLMHGLSASGCPAMTGSAVSPEHRSMITTDDQPPEAAMAPVWMWPMADPAPGHAPRSCVSTPPPAGGATPLALLLALAAIAPAAAAPTPGNTAGSYSRGRRAPPRSGSILLTVLCVSRT